MLHCLRCGRGRWEQAAAPPDPTTNSIRSSNTSCPVLLYLQRDEWSDVPTAQATAKPYVSGLGEASS